MTSERTSVVLGASGQDGTYLVERLVAEGRRVVACGRDGASRRPVNWQRIGIGKGVERRDVDYADPDSIGSLLAMVRPDEIYVLAGQSSVRRSFERPAQTFLSHVTPLLGVLETVRSKAIDAHVVYAGSTDSFGTLEEIGTEDSPFRPKSPYAAGKIAGVMVARSYRDVYGLRCTIAYLSNHESVLRNENFLFGKVLAGIASIRRGELRKVQTGSLSAQRDWGYAPEFAQVLTELARLPKAHEVVVATGRTVILRDAVASLFEAFGLDPAEWLEERDQNAAPAAVDRQVWDVTRLRIILGWAPTTGFPELAVRLRDDLRGLQTDLPA